MPFDYSPFLNYIFYRVLLCETSLGHIITTPDDFGHKQTSRMSQNKCTHRTTSWFFFFLRSSRSQSPAPSRSTQRCDWMRESYRACVLQQLRSAQKLLETDVNASLCGWTLCLCPVWERSANFPGRATGFDSSIKGVGKFYRYIWKGSVIYIAFNRA